MPFVFARVLGRVMVSLPIAVAFVDCVAYVAKVEGVSMQPILNPNSNSKANDYVLLNKWKVRRFNVQRGDIVALKSPRDPDQKLIKRVIGLEGDLVKTLSYKKHYVQVPKGHCWVEGDHHVSSMDSNFFGPIALGLVFAKATLIVWPPSRWQKLESEFSSTRITINDAYDNVSFSTQET